MGSLGESSTSRALAFLRSVLGGLPPLFGDFESCANDSCCENETYYARDTLRIYFGGNCGGEVTEGFFLGGTMMSILRLLRLGLFLELTLSCFARSCGACLDETDLTCLLDSAGPLPSTTPLGYLLSLLCVRRKGGSGIDDFFASCPVTYFRLDYRRILRNSLFLWVLLYLSLAVCTCCETYLRLNYCN